jgi:hypothetical protein
MKMTIALLSLLLLLSAVPPSASSQGEAAVPFLLLSPSPETNGMAGISVAVQRADPLSSIFSPAQVGLASLSTGVAGSFYPEETRWLPGWGTLSPSYKAWAAQGTVLLNDFLDMPVRVGVGLAYHRVDFDIGQFSVTNSSGPEVIETFEAYENATGLTLGVGFEYLVKAGFGYTFRSIISHLSPLGTEMEKGAAEADVPAKDYSCYLLLPMVDLIDAATGGSTEFYGTLRPFADLSLGFGINNIGDEVVYVDAAQPDPLPRTAREGVGVAAGLRLQGWEVGRVTWSREGEDLLVVRQNNGTWEYQSGFGDLEFANNVIAGHSSGNVGIRTGWQLQMGEFFTYRQGAYRQPYNNYDTEGLTFQLAGILKGIAYAAGDKAPSWLLFARDHFDFQYHQSKYTSETSGVDNTQFKALTLLIKVSPL